MELPKGKETGACASAVCGGPFPVKSADLFLGNAGNALRPLTEALALAAALPVVRRSANARATDRRPGGRVAPTGRGRRYLGKEGFPPLEIQPGKIRDTGKLQVSGEVSSQFLTALLMALPLTGKQSTIEVVGDLISKPYVEITLNLMARFGVHVRRSGWTSFTIPAGSRIHSPGEMFVEGDATGASYFLAAGAIGGGPVRVQGVGRGSIQGDVSFTTALAGMGARIEMGDNWIEVRAPAKGRLQAFDLDLNHIPDAAMTLAVTALFANGSSRLRNIASWRVKETDRIAAMATDCARSGQWRRRITFRYPPPSHAYPYASIETYDDHRCDVFRIGRAGRVPVASTIPMRRQDLSDFFDRFAEIAAGARCRSSRSTGRRLRVKARSLGRWRNDSDSIISTAARCIGWWRWRQCGRQSRWTMPRLSAG